MHQVRTSACVSPPTLPRRTHPKDSSIAAPAVEVGASQVFKDWLRKPRSPTAGATCPEETPNTQVGNVSCGAGSAWLAAEVGKPEEFHRNAGVMMDNLSVEGCDGLPELVGLGENANVDLLRRCLLDEKSRREQAEKAVDALRLQVARGDRVLERAVERAVKQTVEAHEDKLRRSREVLQQQLAAVDNERAVEVAKATELAHDMHQRLKEREALVSRLEREQESLCDRVRMEEARRQQAEVDADELRTSLNEMLNRINSIEARSAVEETDRMAAATRQEASKQVFVHHARANAEEANCAVVDDEKRYLLEKLSSSEAQSKSHARDVQGLKVQLENLTAELAAAKAQCAAQLEVSMELEARGKALEHERVRLVEELLGARAELVANQEAAAQLVALKAEMVVSKVQRVAVRTKQNLYDDVMVSTADFRQAEAHAPERSPEQSEGVGIVHDAEKESLLWKVAHLSAEVDEARATAIQELGATEELWSRHDKLSKKMQEGVQQKHIHEEKLELVEGRIDAEIRARKALESLLVEQTAIAKGMEERLEPLHAECLDLIGERANLVQDLSCYESQVSMLESSVTTHSEHRAQLEEVLEATNAQHASILEETQSKAYGDGLIAAASENGAAFQQERTAMAKKVAREEQLKALHKAELQHLQRDLADVQDRLVISDALVTELREGVSVEDSRRHEQEQLYNELIEELRKSIAGEEARSHNEAMCFSQEWDEVRKQFVRYEESESQQAEQFRRERDYLHRRMEAAGLAISVELPSMISRDVVGTAGVASSHVLEPRARAEGYGTSGPLVHGAATVTIPSSSTHSSSAGKRVTTVVTATATENVIFPPPLWSLESGRQLPLQHYELSGAASTQASSVYPFSPGTSPPNSVNAPPATGNAWASRSATK